MKRKTDHNKILFLMLPLTALALYIMRLVSGYNHSEGMVNIGYASSYPLILFTEYAVITLLFIVLIKKKKEDPTLFAYLLPPMLFSALGMLRIDADSMITSREADHAPAIMFIILFAALFIMVFSGHTVTGAAGTLIGTALFPAFGLAFSPYITAAAFLFNDKNKKEKNISVMLNLILTVAATVYGFIRLDKVEFSFSKKYIPVIFLTAVLFIFFTLKKEYKLIPLAALPLFPLVSGMFFGTFSTPIFTLAASVAPLIILSGTAVTVGENENLKGYAQKLVHNPVLYIIITVFILHTACSIFVSPGFFRNAYV